MEKKERKERKKRKEKKDKRRERRKVVLSLTCEEPINGKKD